MVQIVRITSLVLLGAACAVGCASKPAAPPMVPATEPTVTPAPEAPVALTAPPASDPNRVAYDKDAVEVVFRRASRQVRANCGHAKDQQGKASGPWGKATVVVVLGHNGHSKGVSVPAPFLGKPTGICVERAFTNLVFPPFAGSDVEASWEVEIVAPETADTKKASP